jgi:putative DNA primase/helicase
VGVADEFDFDDPPIEAYERDFAADNVVVMPGAKPTDISEDAIALAFTREHGSTMRFDHDAGKWYQWSTTHWRPLNVPAAFHYSREIGRRLTAGSKQMCKASVAGGAERFARADPTHAVTSEIWDSDPWLLGTPKGTLNLKNGRMHSPRPSDGITKLTGCYPEKKDPALWLKFLNDATRGDPQMMTYLQRVAGYCLTGLTTEHALFFIYGPGGNGKSVFLNILVHILGDYAVSAPMDTFTSSKFNSHPTELAMLKGARLVTASETEEGRSWAEARIKALTGGDPITARFMRQDFFTYQPHFKLLFAGNHQPTLNAVDPAMRRRFNMLPFVHRPPEPDHMLEEKLKEEAPRILAWALQGCLDWQRDGLGRPESVVAATDEYFEDQDTFGRWVDEELIFEAGAWETRAILFEKWSAFARRNGEQPGTAKTFNAAMVRLGVTSKLMRAYGTPSRVYQGVKPRTQEQTGWID